MEGDGGSVDREGLLDRPGGRADPLTGNDAAVASVISGENLDQFSFDGLRRKTGLHQETLSRVLDRLEGRGLLMRGAQGYSVVKHGAESSGVSADFRFATVPLLQSLLPDDVNLTDVTSALRGRWFGSLRWLGLTSSSETTVLKWISEDGGIQVDAAFSPGQLEVTANIKEGWRLSDAIKASYELMGHLTRVYARFGARKRVSLLDFWDEAPVSN
ncbi:MAG TPA: hypothetical protein VMS77_07155 [Conexivisphaerales archaeon]|nr:hypothetical protein [Conexivisphaerales archaeon]